VGTLTAGNLTISSSSGFDTFLPRETGNAGNITIQGITGPGSPAASVRLDGSTINTQISEGTAATRPATITITAQTLALANGARIGADTFGEAPAGDITLNVDTLTAGHSTLSSSSPNIRGITREAQGNAGSITIQGITGSGSPAATVSLDNGIVSTTRLLMEPRRPHPRQSTSPPKLSTSRTGLRSAPIPSAQRQPATLP
jgi:hypothetical protein